MRKWKTSPLLGLKKNKASEIFSFFALEMKKEEKNLSFTQNNGTEVAK